MLLLAAYSIGLGIPFVFTALLMNGAQGMLRRLQRHMHKIELLSGTLLVLIGLLVASGQLQSLSQTFSQGEFADFTFRVEECGVGFFEGDLECKPRGRLPQRVTVSRWRSTRAPAAASRQILPQQEYLFHAEAGRSHRF